MTGAYLPWVYILCALIMNIYTGRKEVQAVVRAKREAGDQSLHLSDRVIHISPIITKRWSLRGLTLLIFIFLFSIEVLASPPPITARPVSILYLFAGQTILQSASGLQRVAVGNPEIADVKVLGRDAYLLNGKKAGRSTLMVWDDEGVKVHTVVVTVTAPPDLAQINSLLTGSGIEADWWQEYLILRGSVPTREEKLAVEEMVRRFWQPVISLVTVKKSEEQDQEAKGDQGEVQGEKQRPSTEGEKRQAGPGGETGDNQGLDAVAVAAAAPEEEEKQPGLAEEPGEKEELDRVRRAVAQVKAAIGVPTIDVQIVRDLLILQGTVTREADLRRAEAIARQFRPDVLNLIEVQVSDNLQPVEEKEESDEMEMAAGPVLLPASDDENEVLVSVEAGAASSVVQAQFPAEEEPQAAGEKIPDVVREFCQQAGFTLHRVGKVVLLEGQFESPEDKAVVLAVLAAHDIPYIDATIRKKSTIQQLPSPPPDIKELQRRLHGIAELAGIYIEKVGDRVLLRGTVSTKRAAQLAETLARDWATSGGLTVSNLVQLTPKSTDRPTAAMVQAQMGIKGLVVQWVGDSLVLKGLLSPRQREAAVALAHAFSSKVIDLTTPAPISELDLVEVAEAIGIDTIQVEVVGNAVALRGTVESPERKAEAVALAEAFGYEVIDCLQISEPQTPAPPSPTAGDIAAAIGLSAVSVRIVNDTVVLEGNVSTAGEREKAEAIAATFGKEVLNLISVQLATNKAEQKWQMLQAEVQRYGATLRRVGDSYVLEGEVSQRDAQYLRDLLDQELPHWLDNLSLPPPAPPSSPSLPPEPPSPPSIEVIEAQLAAPGVKCTYVSGELVLQGSVKSEAERERVEKLAAMLYSPVHSFIRVEEPIQQVRVDVCMVEVSHQQESGMGVDWIISLGSSGEPGETGKAASGGFDTAGLSLEGSQAVVSGPGIDSGISESGIVVGPLTAHAQLKALIASGQARILASPCLVTESGQTAEFLAGGEVPVPVQSGPEQQGVEWKPYGVRLKVKPTVLRNGAIHMLVEPEVSSLDWSNGAQVGTTTVPGIRTRRCHTYAVMDSGKTLILGGLLSQQQARSHRHVPLLGDLPILGRLFRSETSSHQQTDVVVFVTPSLVAAVNGEVSD